MIRTFLVMWMMVISFMLFGQDKNIEGTIQRIDSSAIVGVSIHVLNTNTGTYTDGQGRFSLSLSHGKYILHISAVGYASIDYPIDTSLPLESLQITLKESAHQLDDVIVTAQKEEENIQDVPFSITAISSREVNEFRIWNADQMTAIVPNLYAANPGDNRNVTSIRGITSTSYDPSVTTYIDGVSQFSLDTYIAQLFDVDRIEVLRGPQGTLYGRNSMGGVVNILTKRPSNKPHAFVEVSNGNYGQQRYAGGLRIPLVSNKLFLGVSGMYDRSNGFYTNEYNGSDFDKKQSLTGNYYLTYLASKQWAYSLNFKNSSNRNDGAFPLAGTVESAFDNPFVVNQNAISELVDNVLNASLTARYTGPGFNFTSLTTYQSNYRYYKTPIDGDFSPIDGITIINNYGKDWNFVEVVTQEFKFTSPSANASPLKWTAGMYLFYQHVPFKQATHFGEDAAYVGADDTNFSLINTSTGRSKGIALYGQATYSIGDKLDITAGLRYDYEHKDQNGLIEYQHGPNPDPIFEVLPDTSATVSFNSFSPKLSLAYHFNNRSNLYAVYSRGFRAGGLTQLSPDPSQAPLFAYDPEFSNNFEVGVKQTLFDKRIQINAALFYVKVSNAQVPTLVLPEAITVTRNAGELTSTGFEFELSATPLDGLQINYSVGLTDATYNTLNVPNNGVEVDLKGNHQIFTPAVTSMLAVQYAYNLSTSNLLRLVIRGEWTYIGEQYFDLGNTIRQSPYSLFNTRIGIATNSFEVMFWARNLTDEKYIAYAYDFGATHLGEPRNWGITVAKSFGK